MEDNFKKNIMRAVCLAMTGIFMLTGCNPKDSNNGSTPDKSSTPDSSQSAGEPISNTIDAEYVYREVDTLTIPDGYESSQMYISNDMIYTLAYKYSEDYSESTSKVFIFDNSGNVTEEIDIPTFENKYISGGIAIDSEKNLYFVLCEYQPYEDDYSNNKAEPLTDDDSSSEETSEAVTDEADSDDTEEADDSKEENSDDSDSDAVDDVGYDNEYISNETYYLTKYDSSGNEVFSQNLSEYTEGRDYFYIQNILYGKDGNIYLQNDNMIIVTDNSGKNLFTIDTSNNSDISYIEGMFTTKNGQIAATYRDSNNYGLHICSIDSEAKAFGEEYKQVNNINNNGSMISGSGDYDYYYNDRNDLFGVNLETGESTKILNWIDSNVDASNLNTAVVFPDGRVLASYYDTITWTPINSILEKANPEDIKNQVVLTLAGNYINHQIYSAINKFNKDDKYNCRIKLIDYSQYSTEEDWEAGSKKFIADISIGNIPDIILLENSMPMSSLASKGLFADIGEIMDNDSEINREDYLENFLDALSIDGVLYSISPSFNINTLCAKESSLEGIDSWNINDFIEYTENLDSDKQILSDDSLTSDSILSMFCFNSLNDFIDYKNKTCKFDSEDFIKVLEFAGKYPTSEEWWKDRENMSDDEYNEYYEKQYMSYRNGKTILVTSYFYDFSSFHQQEKGAFGEKMKFIGYPSSDGNGSYFQCSNELAISAKSENKDKAWEFLKYFLTDEYQKNGYELPIKKSVLEEKATQAMTPYTYTDENGETVVDKNYYYMNGMEIEIGYMDEEQKNRYMAFIESINKRVSYNSEIAEIIVEETASYFSGDKSAAETAALIQNRVNIYINETL